MMSTVKNMSRWTMSEQKQADSFGIEVDEFVPSPVMPGSGNVATLDEPWSCPEPVLYDEDEDEDEDEESFGDDEEFADDEEYDEEDDDFLEDEEEELDDEESEDEEDDDDEF